MRRIIIDLTPLLPGGDNGGAKIMTLLLIKELAKIASQCQFVLLATDKNYAELKSFKNEQFKIINTDRYTAFTFLLFLLGYCGLLLYSAFFKLSPPLLTSFVNSFSSRVLPTRFFNKYKGFKQKLNSKRLIPKDFLRLKGDLLFCPFTAPFYKNFKIPIVSVIYDLQAHYYPYFFNDEITDERKRHFHDACLAAKRLISISDYVKQTILEKSLLSPNTIKTIHICLAKRLPSVTADELSTTLDFYTLAEKKYLLYPANFWAHKNHAMLFTAFNMYCHRYPESTLKLVCTGANNDLKHFLASSILPMGISSRIIITDYLTDKEFSVLLHATKALIFPSLFEGFGMPILEAMSTGIPVLCSNLTSLPEVAKDAALLFDPRKPDEIMHAIHRIETEPELMATLKQKGLEHAASCGNMTTMAKEYWHVFEEAMAAS